MLCARKISNAVSLPHVHALIAFFSTGFPMEKVIYEIQFRARNFHEPNSISHVFVSRLRTTFACAGPFSSTTFHLKKRCGTAAWFIFPPFFVIPLPRALRFIFAQVYALLQQNDIPVPFHVTMSRDVCYPLKLQPILCIQI